MSLRGSDVSEFWWYGHLARKMGKTISRATLRDFMVPPHENLESLNLAGLPLPKGFTSTGGSSQTGFLTDK